MTAPRSYPYSNRNALWAHIFVDELARSGLRDACIAPGSRSTPLALAFYAHPKLRVYSLIDERSAAFFALGMARAGERPVALLCTSGTAAANLYPAIIEAHYARVPLLVLTADRPHDQRDSGANQTIDQLKLYGDRVKAFVDVAPPEAAPSARTLRSLRTLACRAFALAQDPPAGPVHLNFPFRKPLEPVPVPDDLPERWLASVGRTALEGRPGGEAFTRFSPGELRPTEAQRERLTQALRQAPRGLIVCGPRCPGGLFPQAVAELARAAGYPLLADPLSGVRFQAHVSEHVLGAYETFLPALADRAEKPQLILRFGAMPTSQALGSYLEALSDSGCRQIALSEHGVWEDATHTLSDFLFVDPAELCRRVGEALEAQPRPPDGEWLRLWQRAERIAWETVEAAVERGFFEGYALREVGEALPEGAALVVASSLPVRHLDQFVPPLPKRLKVFANRGASGIDGTVSTALGIAAVCEPTVLVTGDLAFYHDLNGLLALKRCGVKAVMVVLNNDGGGIFHRLPIARHEPPFRELFVTPHGLDFEPIVRAYGAGFWRVEPRRGALISALEEALRFERERAVVLEVRTDAEQHERVRREILQAVASRIGAGGGREGGTLSQTLSHKIQPPRFNNTKPSKRRD